MISLFKECSGCKQAWLSRQGFLTDPNVSLVGYQARINDAENGLFLFNHLVSGCHTTISLRVVAFMDLYEGTVHPHNVYGTDRCDYRCARVDDLSPCSVDCSNAWVRQLMQTIRATNPAALAHAAANRPGSH